MNSKGSMLDLIIVIPLTIVIALVSIFAFMVWDNFETNMPGEIRYDEVNETMANTRAVLLGIDYLFVWLIAGVCFAVILSAFMVRTHPIFFIFSYIILGIEVLVSALLSNVFSEIIGNALIVTYASEFTMMVLFIQNLPLFTLGIGLVIALVMYGKGSGGKI